MAKKVIEIVCANPECKKEFTIFKEEKDPGQKTLADFFNR